MLSLLSLYLSLFTGDFSSAPLSLNQSVDTECLTDSVPK